MEECSQADGSQAGKRVKDRTMTLRRLDIPADQWRVQDITEVRNVLGPVSADPALARSWRGSVVLHFAEVPEGHPYSNPAIADFLRTLYSEFPYLLYFLDPDPGNGSLDSFYAAIGVLSETPDGGVWVLWSDDAATAFYEALAAAAEFAIDQGDDWVAVVEAYEYHEIQTRFAEIRAILISRGVIRT
jgi:hypothetical protein